MSKATVILASNAYYPNLGGVENSLFFLAKAYKTLGYHCVIVVSDVNSFNNKPLPLYEVMDGVEVYRFSATKNVVPFLNLDSFFYGPMKKLFLELLKKFPDAQVISRYHTTGLIAKKVGFKKVSYLVPGIVRFQQNSENTSKVRFLTKVKRSLSNFWNHYIQCKAINLVDHVYLFSRNMLAQQKAIGVNKPATIVKPGVDTERFYPLNTDTKAQIRERLCLPKHNKVLLAVGRFVKAKGFMYALESLLKLPDYHLVLVGDGIERPVYEKFIVENGLSDRVTLTGAIENTAQYYQTADLFLMTSTYEPLGQTILEALAAGLPVVAFNNAADVVTATHELLDEDQAIWVDELDSEVFAKTIEVSLSQHGFLQKLSKQGVCLVKSKYSWQSLAKRLIDS